MEWATFIAQRLQVENLGKPHWLYGVTEEDKKFLSSEVTRILEKTPETEGTIAGDVAKILRSVGMDKK